MKVAIVNQPWNHAPPTVGGSIAIWTWEVARRLVGEDGIDEVYVYARRNPGQQAYEEVNGVRCVRYPIDRDLKMLRTYGRFARRLGLAEYPFKSGWFYRSYMNEVSRDLAGRDVDIVHLHNFSQHVPVVRKQNPRARIILHMHCEWLSQLKRRTIEKRLAGTDAVIGCSGYITGKIRDRFPWYADHCNVVFNGVNVDAFTPGAHPGGETGASGHRLVFVGRITPEKALHHLVEAVAQLSDRFPDVQLDIVGPDAETPKEYIVDLSDDSRVKALAPWYDGDYFQRLEKLARARLGDRVNFVGLVSPPDLPDHYRRADLLLNPSVSESFGMSLVEAMACGTPVVATTIGGMPEIVEHGRTGLLVEPGDPTALSDAIAGLLGDAELRASMRPRCRDRAERLFSWDVVARSLAGRYREVMGARE
ncbi:MAG: glycosyltransferase family 4 protein [Candidatus Latescibacterota bacterium]